MAALFIAFILGAISHVWAGLPMSKGAFADALATACEMKKKDAIKAIASVVEIATAEVKKNGVFTLPGLC
eukprot:CAMPEP_0204531636 /NCGR_PEP_ID=MMETSP0661-20131031/11233_1 /ASSEMBLY_ACC=CAM_ASM_000606 /TAXON_ID=109239 /ORGANISM="Alexandrium margalefi, Strain AMGDE01CS-322" /LENGTH=69 /DNA_ID=CAMNT_0051537803 /DNA_START=380 /DNA_END=586 /DNA_ORIENTATION=-